MGPKQRGYASVGERVAVIDVWRQTLADSFSLSLSRPRPPTLSLPSSLLFDLHSNTALALALARDGEKQKKGNGRVAASRRKKQTPSPSSMLPDPTHLRDLVLAAASDANTLSHRESIDKASLRIAREACCSKGKKRTRETAAEAAEAVAEVDRRRKGHRRQDIEARARAAVGSIPGVAPAVPSSDDDYEEEESDGEDTATLVASVQLAVKQFLVGAAREKRRGRATALPVVGLKEKEEEQEVAAASAASSSYLAASDDDCLLFSAAEELRMPFFASAAAGAEESGRRRRKAAALEGRGERASAVAPAALALAEALRLSLAGGHPPSTIEYNGCPKRTAFDL
jgi:hypothetical protein